MKGIKKKEKEKKEKSRNLTYHDKTYNGTRINFNCFVVYTQVIEETYDVDIIVVIEKANVI